MTDIRSTTLGKVFQYPELIDATQAVWGGVSWPSGENIGAVTVVGACQRRLPGGYELAVLEEFESFDVRAMVRQIEALEVKHWVSWPRDDQRGAPCGRWIGDETHEAAKAFLGETNKWLASFRRKEWYGSAGHRIQIRLHPSPVAEMETLYEFLLPKFRGWLQKDRKLLYLKCGQAELALGQFEALDASDTSGLKAGDHPIIEALGYVCVELQRWLKSRDQSRRGPVSADIGQTSLHA
jgi:hypothetical protein